MTHILGHGIDLVETKRIGEMVEKYGEQFMERVFTPNEQGYAASSKKRSRERLAARFAAKEAVLKALGTGWRSGIAWTDVEVVREASGLPRIKLAGQALEIATEMVIKGWQLSLTHTEGLAQASVIALGD